MNQRFEIEILGIQEILETPEKDSRIDQESKTTKTVLL